MTKPGLLLVMADIDPANEEAKRALATALLTERTQRR